MVAKSNEKVSTDNLSPQQAVSLIATYAGNKYGNDWASMAKKAQKQGLQVNLYPTSKYKLSDNGQGVAYDVTAGGKSTGLVYTINKDNTVNIYQNVKEGKLSHKLATISKQDMASYVNRQGQAKLVGDLAKNAQVIDKQSGSQSNSTSSSTTTGHQYGRQGVVTVPAEMQGTWYSSDYGSNSTITFGKNTILGEDGQQYHLYKQDPNFLAGDLVPVSKTQPGTGQVLTLWMFTACTSLIFVVGVKLLGMVHRMQFIPKPLTVSKSKFLWLLKELNTGHQAFTTRIHN